MKINSFNTGGVLLTDFILVPKTETPVLWYRNDDVDGLVLSLHQLVINVRSRGLSNSPKHTVTARLRVAGTTPSNGIPLAAANIDTSSTFPLPVTAYQNPAGLNMAFPGVLGGTLVCTDGSNQFNFQGNSAISNFPGNSLVVTLESNDSCEVSLNQIFFFRQGAS